MIFEKQEKFVWVVFEGIVVTYFPGNESAVLDQGFKVNACLFAESFK